MTIIDYLEITISKSPCERSFASSMVFSTYISRDLQWEEEKYEFGVGFLIHFDYSLAKRYTPAKQFIRVEQKSLIHSEKCILIVKSTCTHIVMTFWEGCYLNELEVTSVRYNGKALKQNKETECGQTESHNHVNKENELADNMVQYEREYGKQSVVVTLDFPEQSDAKAEQEFIGRLKEIYLRKIKVGARQEKDSALESNSTLDKEDKNHE